MAKFAFIALRVLIGIGAFLSMGATLLLIILTGLFHVAKGLVGAIGAVVTVFASGFQKSPDVAPSSHFPFTLIGLLIMFACIFASVCMPEYKIFLHVVAAMAVVGGAWEIWRAATQPETSIIYTPLLVLWFVYYAICLRRS